MRKNPGQKPRRASESQDKVARRTLKENKDGFHDNMVDHEKFEEMLNRSKLPHYAKRKLVKDMTDKINAKLIGRKVDVTRFYNHYNVYGELTDDNENMRNNLKGGFKQLMIQK